MGGQTLYEQAKRAMTPYLGVTKEMFMCEYVCVCEPYRAQALGSIKTKLCKQGFWRKILAEFVNGQNRLHRFKMLAIINT